MLSAQDSPMGVPRELLEAKKAELQQEQVRSPRSRIDDNADKTCSFPKPPLKRVARRSRRRML
jgi:hypothetical protein